MRALHVPDFSDANPYQRELASHLEARGVSVDMGSRDGFSGFGGLRVLPLLDSVRSAGVPDVLHLHWFHAFVADDRRWVSALLGLQLVLELAVLRLAGVRLVWTVHNLRDHERRLPRRLELALRHAVFRLSHRVIVHCDRAADAVAATYRLPDSSSIATVPHGHYLDSYANEIDRTSARESLGYGDDETVFCYFGRIRAYKNVPDLVAAFRRLSDRDARLLVVGSPRADDLAAAIADRSADDDRIRTVLEFVPEDEVQRYLTAADAVVLPFDDVLSSGSAMLAMSFGRSVIAPALGCVADLVPDGLLYDPADPDGLDAALDRALSTDLEAAGRRNRRVAASFDWDEVARLTHEVYRRGSAPG